MHSTNVHHVQVPSTNKSNSVNYYCCSTRTYAQISAWILVIVHGFLFSSIVFKILNSIQHFDQENQFKDVVIIWDSATGKSKGSDGSSDAGLTAEYFGRLFLIFLWFSLGFGFSILLLIGVQKKYTKVILIWIIYFLVSCSMVFIHIIIEGERYTNFQKVVTVKVIVLSFIIFFLIISYYKELKDMEVSSLPKNLSEVRVTVADPVPPYLQPHLYTTNQPHLLPPYLQNELFQPTYVPKDNKFL